MNHSGISKFGVPAAAGLLLLALSSTPARAGHGSDLFVPLAAVIAIGALAHHHSHYRYEYRYRSHYRPHYQPHYRPHYRPYSRHSHSHGGYGAPGYKHYRNW